LEVAESARILNQAAQQFEAGGFWRGGVKIEAVADVGRNAFEVGSSVLRQEAPVCEAEEGLNVSFKFKPRW
jgi:hypothetical protein